MESPDTPLIHRPNRLDDKSENGLICFLDMSRQCGPDCMAYQEQPEGRDYHGQQWANCMLLVNAHRLAKHVTILTGAVADNLKDARTHAADRARTGQTPPPSPR